MPHIKTTAFASRGQGKGKGKGKLDSDDMLENDHQNIVDLTSLSSDVGKPLRRGPLGKRLQGKVVTSQSDPEVTVAETAISPQHIAISDGRKSPQNPASLAVPEKHQ